MLPYNCTLCGVMLAGGREIVGPVVQARLEAQTFSVPPISEYVGGETVVGGNEMEPLTSVMPRIVLVADRGSERM